MLANEQSKIKPLSVIVDFKKSIFLQFHKELTLFAMWEKK